jgi:hypothetical protein
MIRIPLLAAAAFLVVASAVAQEQWYPAPNPSTEARPPAQQPTPGYPAPGNPPAQQPAPGKDKGNGGGFVAAPPPANAPADSKKSDESRDAKSTDKPSESKKSEVPLIDRVEDAKNPVVLTLKGVQRSTPLTQGRSWKVLTRGVEGGAGGRQYWLKKAKMAPVKMRTERWDEGEMILTLPAGSITADGGYRLELYQDGSLLAARAVQVVAALPDDFDQDGAGRDRDCDDFDARRHPGAKEVCDAAGIDEDCDLKTVLGEKAYADADNDGFGAGEAVLVCDKTKIGHGFALVSGDCNDHDAKVKPGAGCQPAK